MALELYAVTPDGPRALPVPPRAHVLHEIFDELPLGVYSALRTFQHERFLRLEQHFERTDRSAELLGWSERLDRAALRDALAATTRAFPAPEVFVRFDLLAAPARALGTAERTLLALAPLVPVPETILARGAAVRFSRLRRTQPLIKNASFVLERRPYPLGSAEAYEHLILDEEGRILEGTSSNFAALQGRTLRVAGDAALQGITQGVVCELAAELGLAVVREPVREAEVTALDEAFLTGSTRGIVPVVEVEGRRVGAGEPGPWTAKLVSAYHDHVARHARAPLARGPARAPD